MVGDAFSPSKRTQACSSESDGKVFPVNRITDQVPHQILEDMPVPRFYALFAKAGVRTATVVSQAGKFVGMISRSGLILETRKIEENGFFDRKRADIDSHNIVNDEDYFEDEEIRED